MRKTHYSDEPSRLDIGKTYVIFRWGIERVELDEERTEWTAYELRINAPVTTNKVIEEVFTAYYGNDHENKLINEYNSAQLGIITGEAADKARAAYSEFLQERAALKADIERLIATASRLRQI